MADEQITSNTANIPYVNFLDVGADQTAPTAGRAILYIKSGVANVRLPDGTVTPIGGAVALADGQLAVGNGSGVLSALALGTEGDVVTADAGGKATWAAPGGGPGGGRETLIASHTFNGTDTSHTFSSIPDTYTHLMLEHLVRSERAAQNFDILCWQANSDNGADQYLNNITRIQAGSAAGYSATSTRGWSVYVPGGTTNSAARSFGRTIFPAYATTHPKPGFGRASQWYALTELATIYADMGAGVWKGTGAITSLTVLLSDGAAFTSGSTLALYGVS